VSSYGVLEHREGRSSRWLRGNRLRVAFLIALVETILVLTNVISWWWAVLLALLIFVLHYFVGRKARAEWIRQLSWTAAVSQTLPVVVPFVALVVSVFLVIGLVAAGVVILAYIILGRR
jgi:uncharacterized membrane protein